MKGARIIVYQKQTCTTCRQVHASLKEAGVEFDAVDYYVQPLTAAKLTELLRKMGMRPRDLLRTKEDAFRELRLAERNLPDGELIALMVEHPDLLQRPIVERGDRAVLARPAERLKAFLA